MQQSHTQTATQHTTNPLYAADAPPAHCCHCCIHCPSFLFLLPRRLRDLVPYPLVCCTTLPFLCRYLVFLFSCDSLVPSIHSPPNGQPSPFLISLSATNSSLLDPFALRLAWPRCQAHICPVSIPHRRTVLSRALSRFIKISSAPRRTDLKQHVVKGTSPSLPSHSCVVADILCVARNRHQCCRFESV